MCLITIGTGVGGGKLCQFVPPIVLKPIHTHAHAHAHTHTHTHTHTCTHTNTHSKVIPMVQKLGEFVINVYVACCVKVLFRCRRLSMSSNSDGSSNSSDSSSASDSDVSSSEDEEGKEDDKPSPSASQTLPKSPAKEVCFIGL